MDRDVVIALAEKAGMGIQYTNNVKQLWGGEMQTRQMIEFANLVIEEYKKKQIPSQQEIDATYKRLAEEENARHVLTSKLNERIKSL